MIECASVVIVFQLLYLYYILTEVMDSEYYVSWICVIIVMSLQAAFYIMTKKFQIVALQFANIQTVFCMVVIIELTALHQTSPTVDGFTALTALVASLSSVSYCKK